MSAKPDVSVLQNSEIDLDIKQTKNYKILKNKHYCSC